MSRQKQSKQIMQVNIACRCRFRCCRFVCGRVICCFCFCWLKCWRYCQMYMVIKRQPLIVFCCCLLLLPWVSSTRRLSCHFHFGGMPLTKWQHYSTIVATINAPTTTTHHFPLLWVVVVVSHNLSDHCALLSPHGLPNPPTTKSTVCMFSSFKCVLVSPVCRVLSSALHSRRERVQACVCVRMYVGK